MGLSGLPRIDMRPCEVCNRTDAEQWVAGPDYEYGTESATLWRCRHCGHVQIGEFGDFASIYPTTYYTQNPQSPIHVRGYLRRKQIQVAAARVAKLRPGRLLDVGCGDMGLLCHLQYTAARNRLVGLDYVHPGFKHPGVDFHTYDVNRGLPTIGQFDLVLMRQLIEHVRYPRTLLVSTHLLLDRKGQLLIETPSPTGLDYRLGKRLWGGYHIPRHFHIFSRDGLGQLAKESGFKVVDRGYSISPGFWILTLRNMLGFRSDRFSGTALDWILSFRCLPTVALFSAIDRLRIAMGLSTSNQFVLLEKE